MTYRSQTMPSHGLGKPIPSCESPGNLLIGGCDTYPIRHFQPMRKARPNRRVSCFWTTPRYG